jgi:hypothetical protein
LATAAALTFDRDLIERVMGPTMTVSVFLLLLFFPLSPPGLTSDTLDPVCALVGGRFSAFGFGLNLGLDTSVTIDKPKAEVSDGTREGTPFGSLPDPVLKILAIPNLSNERPLRC